MVALDRAEAAALAAMEAEEGVPKLSQTFIAGPTGLKLGPTLTFRAGDPDFLVQPPAVTGVDKIRDNNACFLRVATTTMGVMECVAPPHNLAPTHPISSNLARAVELAEAAGNSGAQLLVLPEAVSLCGDLVATSPP